MSNVIPAGFGPQEAPYLQNVTQLTGTGYNSLAAVPTVNLTVPFMVEIDRGSGSERWQLQAYVAQSGPGTNLPNDFNGTTNPKIWVIQS